MLIWALDGSDRFPKKILDNYLLNPKNTVLYSSVSLLEIDMKHAVDPQSVPFDAAMTQLYCEKAGFFEVQFRGSHAIGFGDLISKHGLSPNVDIYTHMLINQAITEEIVLFTHYTNIGKFSSPYVYVVQPTDYTP